MSNKNRLQGEIRSLRLDKGFGFLLDDDGTERFFHRSGLAKGLELAYLEVGQRVSFMPTETAKGKRAEDVRTLPHPKPKEPEPE